MQTSRHFYVLTVCQFLESGMNRWCVYVLRDPRDGLVRYVGMTGNPKRRKAMHNSFLHGPMALRRWRACLRISGKKIVFETVSSHATKDAALQAESELILWYQDNHPSQLYVSQLTRKSNNAYIHRGWNQLVSRDEVLALEFIAGCTSPFLKPAKGSFLGIL
jgi:predicted GIY-YIG superfamily endonuclease